MRKKNVFVTRLLRDPAGATAIEYGLIISLVVLTIIVSVSSVADETTGLWAIVRNAVDDVYNGS